MLPATRGGEAESTAILAREASVGGLNRAEEPGDEEAEKDATAEEIEEDDATSSVEVDGIEDEFERSATDAEDATNATSEDATDAVDGDGKRLEVSIVKFRGSFI